MRRFGQIQSESHIVHQFFLVWAEETLRLSIQLSPTITPTNDSNSEKTKGRKPTSKLIRLKESEVEEEDLEMLLTITTTIIIQGWFMIHPSIISDNQLPF